MTTSLQNVTQESLLVRLQNVRDSHAWDRFYYLYRGLIVGYVKRRGISDQLAQDVLQETLITLTKTMPTFEYDRLKGRFRFFLLRIVNSRLVDAIRRERKHSKLAGDEAATKVVATELSGTATVWDDEWNKEWERQLLARAIEKVKERVQPHVYESFTRYVLQREPVDRVAEALGISKNSIYEHRHRLIIMIKSEVELIRADWGE